MYSIQLLQTEVDFLKGLLLTIEADIKSSKAVGESVDQEDLILGLQKKLLEESKCTFSSRTQARR